jgi:Arc/MetJ-type ribon-helix-helix transcriptional regulator
MATTSKNAATVVSVSMPAPLAAQIERARKADHRSRSEVVREALRHYFRAQGAMDEAGRKAYLNAKAGIGLSPAYDTADEFLDALHQATKRPPVARRRAKK